MKQILSLFVASLLLGCGSSALTGTLVLQGQGADLPEELAAGVFVDWDEEVNWTRQVLCLTAGDLESTTYELRSYDRSVAGGIELFLSIQAYDGPGDYDRDEFQPTPALTIEFLEEFDEEDEDEGEGDDDDSAGEDPEGDDDESWDDEDDWDEDDDLDLGIPWHFGTDSGGECGITVDEGGRSGSFNCGNIPAFVDFDRTGDLVGFSGSWTCSDLDSVDSSSGLLDWTERF